MIETDTFRLYSGDLLIAPPQMADPRFRKTVMMVTHDHEGGSFALCLNKCTENSLSKILRSVDIELDWDQNLFWGGPVNSQTVWMLHDPEWRNEYTISVNEHWAMTSHISMFEQLRQGHLPSRQRICFGFASWSPGQLLSELAGKHPYNHNSSWLILNDPDPDWLINADPEDLWTQATQQSAIKAVENWL